MRFESLLGLWALLAVGLAACSGGSAVVGSPDGGTGTMDAVTDGTMDVPVSCMGTQTACAGRCVDTQGDRTNCGACGHACADLMVCTAGTCQVGCPAGQSACGGTCVTFATDNANCGTCGAACIAGQVCSRGACGTTCDVSLATCMAAPDAGPDAGPSTYCADVRLDRLNCGACGNVCPAGDICVDRVCQLTCATGQTSCTGTCRDLHTDNANCGTCGHACPSGTQCAAGTCVTSCSSGLTDCAGTCANLQTDNANCSACGQACAAGTVCSRGACGATCAPPLATCGGTGGDGGTGGGAAYCANTQIDPANCGACGTACALPHVATTGCTGGACTVVRCADGFGDCDGTAANGCETDLQTTLASCGACGRTCVLPNATSTCAVGTCAVAACNAGHGDCDRDPANGCEVNLNTDNGSCGTCDHGCPAGTVCSAGTCGTTCAPPLATCTGAAGSSCANTAVDPANCGACGTVCALAGAAVNGCVAGHCTVVSCAPGRGNCDLAATSGCETDLTTSLANCGACGRGCSLPNATPVCAMGNCTIASCATNFADCDHAPGDGCEANTQTDLANCGACGHACGAGQVCSHGACSATCALPLTTCGTGATAYCANTQIDPANCGACGTPCALPGAALDGCVAGHCTIAQCNAGRGDCDGVASNGCETDLQTTVASCGACGHACSLPNAMATCAGGACGIAACSTNFQDCNHDPADGCEANTRSDGANCGACGHACGAAQVCSAGVCGALCASPLVTCGVAPATYCANPAIDPANCGTCGHACALANTATNSCVAGACVPLACAPGFGNCNGIPADGCEVNLATDANCGACGVACRGGQTCAASVCACPVDQTLCGSACTATATDITNCGACGHACALPNASSTCAAGTCHVATCNGTFQDCNHDPADGCEANTQSDNTNCGACGHACGAAQVCSAGVCGALCASPLVTCGVAPATYCANPAIDPANCGTCGHACALANTATNSCVAGACVPLACAPGFGNCNGIPADGCEAVLATDGANCGACGVACGGGQTCAAGACACPGGQSFCGSACTATAVDPANCGTCGHACALSNASSTCAASACRITTCNPGFADCDTNPANGCEVNTQSDNTNCGACGHACGGGQVCSGGACSANCATPLSSCDTGPAAYCANLASDPNNCGVCHTVCGPYNNAVATCAAGHCALTCNAGFADCDGVLANGCEVNTTTDAANCGGCRQSCGASRACAGSVCVGAGSQRFTLVWSLPGDLDLHVVTPAGHEIYYRNRGTVTDGGQQDRDDTVGTGPENIFWTAPPPLGTYLICVDAYNISASETFTVTVARPGFPDVTFTGSRTVSDFNSPFPCTTSASNYVGSITN